jgi:hypothetical protein
MKKENSKFKFSKEAENPGSLCTNLFLFEELNRLGKLNDYIQMASLFPNGNLGKLFLNYLNNLTREETTEIAEKLYSLRIPLQLSPDLYSDRKSAWGKMFELSTRGSGNGEVLIVWLIKDSYMNGGKLSYDINIGDKKYEVKDCSEQGNSSILAGVKSKVSNFQFWREIVDTIRRIEKLTEKTNGEPKFSFAENFSEEVVSASEKIKKISKKILSGELNMSDLKLFTHFYSLLSQCKSKYDGHTNIILRGPNVTPVELSINNLTLLALESFLVSPRDSDPYTYMLTELRRLKYVRNPHELEIDMQEAVNQITAGVTYIIFRKSQINITNSFKPTNITISSLKFRECLLTS